MKIEPTFFAMNKKVVFWTETAPAHVLSEQCVLSLCDGVVL